MRQQRIHFALQVFIKQLIVFSLLWSSFASAHALKENYVYLNVESDHLSGMFEINVADIRNKLGIDVDAVGSSRLEGVQSSASAVQEYLVENFRVIENTKALELTFLAPTLFSGNQDYLRYHFTAPLPAGNRLSIFNSIFITPEYIKNDRLHRSMLVYEYNRRAGLEFGDENVPMVFKPERFTQPLDLENPPNILTWKDFLWQGVLHILVGYDHILFILVLLLTTVVREKNNEWVAVDSFRSALWNTFRIVTVFTIAHSITLTLAAFDLVQVNIVLVETIIAASIIGIAVCNLFPKVRSHAWLLIFVFGLFHGLGFASVMGDLQFRTVLIERILILFNVGVELGQMAIVICVMPVLYLIRRSRYYTRIVINLFSLLAIAVSLFWVAQRLGVIEA
jgi:hypothetical protein